MKASLHDWLGLIQFPTGTRLWVFYQMKRAFEELGLDGFSELLAEATAHDRETLELEATWRDARLQPTPRYGDEAVKLDNRIDGTLGAINQILEAHIVMSDGSDRDAIQELRTAAFPGGVVSSIHLSFVEEVAELERILGLLDAKYKATVGKLGLTASVADLRRLTEEFRTELAKAKSPEVDYGAVRAARAAGQEYLLRLIVRILAEHDGAPEQSQDAMQQLLGPVMVQEERIRSYLSRRRAVPDIDPETGDELQVDPEAVVTV